MTEALYSHDLTGPPPAHARSPRWPRVERLHKLREPGCRGCGRRDGAGGRANDVHHLVPFHLRPELELDDANLVTVCRDCHFRLAHAGNWSNWVKNCADVLGAHLARLSGRPAAEVVPVVAG